MFLQQLICAVAEESSAQSLSRISPSTMYLDILGVSLICYLESML